MAEMSGTGRARGRWSIPRAKFAPPRVPGYFVRRPVLRERLGEAVSATGVTLVCAPAGYGKTLLLADWVEATGVADKAWVTLDSGEASPAAFLTVLLAAVRECAIVPAQSRIHDLGPPRPGDCAAVLAALIDAIDVLPGPLYLVLDDVQSLPGEAALGVLTGLVRNQPDNLRLVLAACADPPLPLARLRVEGRLAEFRGEQLRFSVDEVSPLLRAAGVELTGSQVRRLVELTDGWVAGLRLAARSLRGAEDPDRFLDNYARDDRTIADFLAGEVLGRLPDRKRRLLRLLSVCEHVTPELAGSLSGEADAGAVLAELERENSLVTALGADRRWYRIHPLLRSYLSADLNRASPGLVHVLHKIVAVTYAEEGHNRQALWHACHSEDSQAIVSLLRSNAVEMLLFGEPDLVLDGVAAAGAAAAVDPWLVLFSALAWLEKGEFAAAERALARAAADGPGRPEHAFAELRRLIVSAYACAAGRLPTATDEAVGTSGGQVAWACTDRAVTLAARGDGAGALRELQIAEDLGRWHELDYLLMHRGVAHAFVAATDRDYPAMERACEEALALAASGGWQNSPWLPVCRAMLGLAKLVHLDPAGALRTVDTTGESASPAVRFAGQLVGGAACFDRGDRTIGLEQLHAARRELGDRSTLPALVATAALTEHQCALELGRFPQAREVADWAAHRLGSTPEIHLMAARTAFAHGDLDSVARFLPTTRQHGLVPMTGVQAWLTDAALALAGHRRTRARYALGTALRVAKPADVLRPFAYAEPEVRRLLVDQLGGFGGSDAFAGRVWRAVAGLGDDSGRATLTGRERAVLMRLTSPRPLEEIACQLSVSVNTVKTHVRAIYAKLGVSSRREAVVVARERGLD